MSNKNVIDQSNRNQVLKLLNDDGWKVDEICIEGNCEKINEDSYYPFGIDTRNSVNNFCTSDEGEFYTIGKYVWAVNYDDFKRRKIKFSDPDYFKISEYLENKEGFEVDFCTQVGYYQGILSIVDNHTLEIIANRPDFGGKKVKIIYLKK